MIPDSALTPARRSGQKESLTFFSIEACVQAFASIGYEPCETADLEPGSEKIAIYADELGEPTHAARQLASGRWTSKMGDLEDIEHADVHAVEGPLYGRAVAFMKRARL